MNHLKSVLMVILVLSVGAPAAMAFQSFNDCSGCHQNFKGPGEVTHDLHNTFINSCLYCHRSVGDTPDTYRSGMDPSNGCSGCHTGGGTAQHHVTTGASGCGCHSDTGQWPRNTEDFEPPYFDTAATSLRFSCFDGIDNDGDNLYDGNDADCAGVPADDRSWTVIKEYYGSE